MTYRNDPEAILWLDLETTGSDFMDDEILEVGCVLTDMEFNELDERSYVIEPYLPDWQLLMNDVVKDMHRNNGLIEDVEDKGVARSFAETQLTHWITNVHSYKEVQLAGSGVSWFDSRFLYEYMPDLFELCSSPMLDIGVYRRFLKRWGLVQEPASDAKAHRALDDAKAHLQEAKSYQHAMKRAFPTGSIWH